MIQARLSAGDALRGPSFLTLIEQQSAAHPDVVTAVERLRDLLVEPSDARPFLSVLLRTRGMRVEPLDDALLCLAAQTDQDFEVVVVDHDSAPEGAAAVRQLVESQPEWFRERISIVEVKGGTRSRPLNQAVAHAKGRYVAVFDDDDLLFAHWVEQFHAHADEAAGRLMRSHVAIQQFTSELWHHGLNGYRATSRATAEYARNFDQIDHLLVNHSPFMSIAFPRTVFTRLGLSFDEELLVCEDWDLILRASLILGVDDVHALTAVYRRWHDSSTSYTEHSREQWLRSEARVIDRLDASTVLLPPGSVKRLRELLDPKKSGLEQQLELVVNSRSWKITRPLRFVTNRVHRVKGTLLHYRNLLRARGPARRR